MKQPALFVSHGSPMIVLDESPARDFLESYGRALAKPKAILVASAHYEAPGPSLTSGARPETIHDFGNFPRALFEKRYPAPGAPEIAKRAADLLRGRGFLPHLDDARGFDHGVWTPLMLMRPQADIPVVALSVDAERGPEWHYDVGRALSPLRDEGVMIVGSGSATHNLRAFFQNPLPADAPAPDWVADFRVWLDEAIENGRLDDLLNMKTKAPHAGENHPTDEHILPLFVALGAGATPGRRLHASLDHGVLAMDAYAF